MAARHVAFAATPVDHYPRSAAAGDTMAGYISTEQYLWGLRRILDGIAARVGPDMLGEHQADGAGGSLVEQVP
jgi:TetR/AcrR family tetracycline transcriptional repressor